jgi:transposase
MEANALFEIALGLGTHWKVVESRLEGGPKRLTLKLEPVKGLHWKCPECESYGPMHDTVERTWRHLNFFQYQSELVAKVPRCRCEKHGVRQVEVPWARAGSGFTLMFEALVMLLCQQAAVSEVAQLLDEQDTRLWRILCAYVEQAQARRDWSKVTRILVDEVSSKRGHRYVTNFLDEETRELLFMVEGRKAHTVGEFVKALRAHGGRPEQIAWVGLDMSAAYIAGIEKYLPQAKKAFDLFHIAQLAGAALDEVRRRLHAEHGGLKEARWSILGNEWTRSPEQQKQREELRQAYPKLGRALGLRESLQDALATKDEAGLKWWCGWAARSRLEPFRKLARTLKAHWDGILGYFESGITSAAIEAINGKLQLAKRIARGFRNFEFFRAIAYLKTARLNLNLPSLKPA